MSGESQRVVRRAIRRLLVSLGIAAVLALLSLLWSRKRLTHQLPDTIIGTETPPPLPLPARGQAEHCSSSGASAASSAAAPAEEAPAAGPKRWQAAALLTQSAFGVGRHEGSASEHKGSAASPPSPHPPRSPQPEKKFAAFVSHMKAEASMEARFLQGELETAFGQHSKKIFLDSDDLRTLSDLTTHVRESDVNPTPIPYPYPYPYFYPYPYP